MSNDKLTEALRSLRLKFTSGNGVPVPEARITRAEWEALEQAHSAEAARVPDDGFCMETMNADNLRGYDYAVAHFNDALKRVLDNPHDRAGVCHAEWQALRERIWALQDKAAEAAQAQAQSGEWVMVPRKITQEMEDAADRRDDDEPPSDWGKMRDASRQAIWDAMLAAAPQQAAEPVGMLSIEDDDSIPQGKTAVFHYADACLRLPVGYHEIYTHPQPAQDAKLPSDEDFRLHLGELTPTELRVARAAFRYAMAKESGR